MKIEKADLKVFINDDKVMMTTIMSRTNQNWNMWSDHGCSMFIYMTVWNKLKDIVGYLIARLKERCMEQSLAAGLAADDSVLQAENEMLLQRNVNECERMCRRRYSEVNAG